MVREASGDVERPHLELDHTVLDQVDKYLAHEVARIPSVRPPRVGRGEILADGGRSDHDVSQEKPAGKRFTIPGPHTQLG
jgi:hypothetical protein